MCVCICGVCARACVCAYVCARLCALTFTILSVICAPVRCPHCVGHSIPLYGPSVEHRHHPPDGTLQSPVERGGGGGGGGGRRERDFLLTPVHVMGTVYYRLVPIIPK